MDYRETIFQRMLLEYGLWRVVWCSEAGLGIIVLFCMWLWPYPVQVATVERLLTMAVEVSAAALSILVAGFAIVASLTDDRFVVFVYRLGVLKKLVFPFWLTGLLWGLAIGTGLVAVALLDPGCSTSPAAATALLVAKSTASFCFSYALAATVRLLGTTLRFLLYRAEVSGDE